jgi:hypothetical protein
MMIVRVMTRVWNFTPSNVCYRYIPTLTHSHTNIYKFIYFIQCHHYWLLARQSINQSSHSHRCHPIWLFSLHLYSFHVMLLLSSLEGTLFYAKICYCFNANNTKNRKISSLCHCCCPFFPSSLTHKWVNAKVVKQQNKKIIRTICMCVIWR